MGSSLRRTTLTAAGARFGSSRSGHHCCSPERAQSFPYINLSRLREDLGDGFPLTCRAMLFNLTRDAEPLLRAEAFAVSAAIGSENSKVEFRAYFKDDSGRLKRVKKVFVREPSLCLPKRCSWNLNRILRRN